MREFTEELLVLRADGFREHDLRLSLLSPTRGIFSAFAFGAAKSRRRFVGCLEPCNRVLLSFRASKTGAYLHATEGVLLDGHPRLRSETSRLGMAANCLAFLRRVRAGGGPYADVAAMTADTLSLLDGPSRPPMAVPVFYRAKLCFTTGFAPALSACARCGADLSGGARFSPSEGRGFCRRCAQGAGRLVPVSGPSVRLLSEVAVASPLDWPACAAAGRGLGDFYGAVEAFVSAQLGSFVAEGRLARGEENLPVQTACPRAAA